MLKPQDIVIAVKLCALKEREWKYSTVAHDIHMSQSEVHSGVKRLKKCGLLTEFSMSVGGNSETQTLPDKENILEFLEHGIRYVFPAEKREPVNGLPTSYGLGHLFKGYEGEAFIPVWEYPAADYFGFGIKPLYKTLPLACIDDFELYELMALVDAVRDQDKLLREFAISKLKVMI